MANNLTIEQVYTALNAIQKEATGNLSLATIDTYTFTTNADITLKTGYDTVMNAISQVLSRTIFSVRPYSAKFKGMEMTGSAWGNHVRKLAVADSNIESDEAYTYPEAYDASKTNAELGNGVTGADMFHQKTGRFADQFLR